MSINTTPKKSRHFSFDVQTAIDYGVDEAIMIQNFIFWIEKNLANNKNYHDGRTWTYNTQEAFTFLFPFWSKKQVWRIIGSLEKQGVLLKGNYNQSNYDKTLWYAFKDESQWLNFPEEYPQSLEDVDIPKREHRDSQTGTSGFPNGNIGIPKREHRDSQMASPIPDTTTNALTNVLPNNNHALATSTNSTKSVNEILLLSLVGLNDKQKAEASTKLAQLSPDQRNIAIQVFNKTVSLGGVKSSPMALLNKLVNLGLKNELEPIGNVEPIQITPPAPQKPAMSDKEYRIARVEVIRALISDPKRKEHFLIEFEEKGAVYHSAVGGAIMKPDLEAAGLFN